MIEIINLNKN